MGVGSPNSPDRRITPPPIQIRVTRIPQQDQSGRRNVRCNNAAKRRAPLEGRLGPTIMRAGGQPVGGPMAADAKYG
jgi:hypothetical protein